MLLLRGSAKCSATSSRAFHSSNVRHALKQAEKPTRKYPSRRSAPIASDVDLDLVEEGFIPKDAKGKGAAGKPTLHSMCNMLIHYSKKE